VEEAWQWSADLLAESIRLRAELEKARKQPREMRAIARQLLHEARNLRLGGQFRRGEKA
jgi:hypothetical protein